MSSTLLRLPPELLSHLVRFLAISFWPDVALVCRALHRAVWSRRTITLPSPRLIEHLARFNLLNLLRVARVSDEASISELARLPSLRYLHLFSLRAVQRGWVTALQPLSCLQTLVLSRCAVSPEDLSDLLQRLSFIEELQLPWLTITDDVTHQLARLERLKQLNLHACHGLSSSNVQDIARIRSLTYLNISISDTNSSIVELLPRMPRLTRLILGLQTAKNFVDLSPLAHLSTLTSLSLNCESDVQHALHLPPALQHLDLALATLRVDAHPALYFPSTLSSIAFSSVSLAKQFYERLHALPRLARLNLILVSGIDEPLAANFFSSLTTLESLYIWDCTIAPDALTMLSRLTKLSLLVLFHDLYQLDPLSALENLTKLELLRLGHSEAVFPATLTKLCDLSIGATNADALIHFLPRSLPSLRRLVLSVNLGAVTDQQVEDFIGRFVCFTSLTCLETSFAVSSKQLTAIVAQLPLLTSLQVGGDDVLFRKIRELRQRNKEDKDK